MHRNTRKFLRAMSIIIIIIIIIIIQFYGK